MSSTPTAASTAPLRFDRVVASVNRFEGLAGPDASAVVDTTTEDSGSVRSLQSAIDHLAGPLAARPEAALAEAGLHEVRSYRITVGGETRYNVVALDDVGELRTATAWSPAGAVALLLAEVAAAPLAA